MLIQSGKPFGAEAKVLPSLSVSFREGGPQSTTSLRRTGVVEGDFSQVSSVSRSWSGEPREKIVVYAELLSSEGGGDLPNLSTNELAAEDLAASSRDGKVLLVVTVSAKGQSKK